MDREVVDLYLDDLIPNRFQPREVFDEKALQELAISIKEHGVIQPIIVRKIGDKYEIIAGERRYKASALAGLTKIPAIIRNLDDKETSKVALLENLQRKDLTAIEEARTYQKILELDAMTQEELGKTMGKSQPAIANKIRLLDLPDEIQESLLHNQISERHARSLLSLATTEEQIKMLNKIIANRMTVREVDEEIKNRMLATKSVPILEDDMIDDETDEKGKYNNIEASSSFDIEEIKNRSTDIITPINKMVDINELLKVSPKKQEEPIEEFRFVGPQDTTTTQLLEEIEDGDNYDVDLIMPKEPILNKEEDMLASLESSIIEPSTQSSNSLKETINIFRDTVGQIKSKGFDVNIDELDLENTYQIIIKINKNN